MGLTGNILDKRIIGFLLLLLLFSYSTQAQPGIDSDYDEESGLEAGLNMGAFFAARNTANFYNGAGNEEGMNSADRVIYNVHYMTMINEVLEQNGYRYLLQVDEYGNPLYYAEYPAAMKFLPSIYAGLTGRYWLSGKLGVAISMNFSRLTTSDKFVIYNEIEMPPSNKEEQYILGNIAGQDDRVNINLGLINKFELSDRLKFIMEYGVNLNNTTVKFNKIEIYSLVLDIMYKGPHDYVPGGMGQQYAIRQGGIGYGGYLAPGLQLSFSNDITMELVCDMYYSYISIEHYSGWGFHMAPFVRFNFTSMFN